MTAQKREQDIQSVPVAITAITSATIERQGLRTMSEFVRLAPNVVFDTGSNSRGGNVSIRGVAAIDNDISAVDQSATVYIDGVPVTGASGFDLDLADVQRVEVLRGPQGTLFGRGSTAGAISVITKPLGPTPNGQVAIEVGNLQRFSVRGAVGGAIAPTLFGRISASMNKREGVLQRNISGIGPTGLGTYDHMAVRAALRFEPTSSITADLVGEHFDYDDVPVALDPTWQDRTVRLAPSTQFNNPANPSALNYERRKVDGIALTGRVVGDALQFISISGYRYTYSDTKDPSSLPFGPFDGSPVASASTLQIGSYTQEFRLESVGSTRLDWIVGAFGAADRNVYVADGVINGKTRTLNRARNYGVFAHANFHVTDQLTLSGGLRNSWDTHRSTNTNRQNVTLIIPAEKSKKLTPELSIRYGLTDDQSVYATYAQGYKSGGLNRNLPPPTVAKGWSYGPESATSYEAGYKSLLFNRRVRFNADVFYIKFKDKQEFVAAAGNFFILNAGDVDSYGAEAEMTARISDQLQFDGSVGLLHAEYKSYKNCPGPLFTFGDCTGKRTLRAPPVNASAGLTYTTPINAGLSLVGDLQARYRGEQFYSPENYAFTRAKPLLLVNASVALRSEKGWGIQAYVRNVFKQDYPALLGINFTATAGWGRPAEPRTYGARITAAF